MVIYLQSYNRSNLRFLRHIEPQCYPGHFARLVALPRWKRRRPRLTRNQNVNPKKWITGVLAAVRMKGVPLGAGRRQVGFFGASRCRRLASRLATLACFFDRLFDLSGGGPT